MTSNKIYYKLFRTSYTNNEKKNTRIKAIFYSFYSIGECSSEKRAEQKTVIDCVEEGVFFSFTRFLIVKTMDF